jgi:hypothetical protein
MKRQQFPDEGVDVTCQECGTEKERMNFFKIKQKMRLNA